MPSPNWNDDEELMRALRTALRTRVVDDQTLTAAQAAYSWLSLDADLELARIRYDSWLDEQVMVRGEAGESPRTLSFQGKHYGVEIELSAAGIEGQLIPPQAGQVTLMTAAGRHATATADTVGCFAFVSPPRGPVRLECSTDAGKFKTEWVTI
jgi:hypothetical protein